MRRPARSTRSCRRRTRARSCNRVFRDGLVPAMRTSPVVFRAFLRWFNLIATPDALMADPEIVAAVLAAYNDRDNRVEPPPLGPTRPHLLRELVQ